MRHITVYSPEMYDKGLRPYIQVPLDTTNKTKEQIDEEIKALRKEHKQKNIEYRRNNSTPKKRRMFLERKIQQKIVENKEPNSTAIHNGQKEPPMHLSNRFKLHIDEDTGTTTLIVGSSKQGKSTLLMEIFNKYYSKPKYITTLFSISSHIKLYNDKKKDSKNRLIKCRKFDESCVKYINEQRKVNFKNKNAYNFVEIFDDITNIRHNNLVNQLVLTYRNSNISSIISLQYINLLAKQSRGSINNIIFFGFNNDESIIVCLNSYLKSHFSKMGYKTENEQINLYRKLTKDHQFLIYHPQSNSLSLHKLLI